jgi:hypothetical protein
MRTRTKMSLILNTVLDSTVLQYCTLLISYKCCEECFESVTYFTDPDIYLMDPDAYPGGQKRMDPMVPDAKPKAYNFSVLFIWTNIDLTPLDLDPDPYWECGSGTPGA